MAHSPSSKVSQSAASGLDSRAPRRWLLYLTVIISGGAVMILELLGTRIIGPFYGVSLYVWSSLIAVTLIALALGYYVGGYLADRHPVIRLPHVILAGAMAAAVIPFISAPILTLTDPLGIRLGGFVSAFLLFTLPLTCLAMVGPFVIKLATHDINDVGTAAGSVYAISTLGSVAGTLLLGFWLLPSFGTRAIVCVLALVLSVLALLLLWTDRAGRSGTFASVPVLLAVAGVVVLASVGYSRSAAAVPGFTLLHEEESTYGWVRVLEDQRSGSRLLLSDASVLSAEDVATGHSLLDYQMVFRSIRQFRPDTQNALLIGLGGGHVAKDLQAAGVQTDTIEIDPAVADAAKRYFRFVPSGEFIVGDARYEVRRLADRRYDFIMHDCFTGGSEPIHLLTVEMLEQLRAMLRPGGVLSVNYVGFREGEGADAVASVHRTLRHLFPHVRVITTTPEDFTDFVFLASDHPLELDERSADWRSRWLIQHDDRAPNADRGIVVTDDFNPMESLQVRKAELYRKVFIERLAFDLLVR